MTKENQVKIFDTTLRDGEQSPGAALTMPEKLRIAHQLAKLNVDVIEAGFPISSPGDFEAVHAIGQELSRSTITGLARCVPADIDRAACEAAALANEQALRFIGDAEVRKVIVVPGKLINIVI